MLYIFKSRFVSVQCKMFVEIEALFTANINIIAINEDFENELNGHRYFNVHV